MSNYLVTAYDDGYYHPRSEEETETGAIETAQAWSDIYTDIVIWKRHAAVEKVVAFVVKPVEEG